MMPLKLLQKLKYKCFFNASIPLSTHFNVAPLSSSFVVFSKFNKGKAHVVVDGDLLHLLVGLLLHLTLTLLALIMLTSLLMKEVKNDYSYEEEMKG
jgi:glycerol-3-phosphate acyltransferase PlsY